MQGKKYSTPIVDSSMSLLGYMPYQEVKAQNILHMKIHILFIYQNMLFIREIEDNKWCLSSINPVMHSFSKEETIEHTMRKEFDLHGVHIAFLSQRKRVDIPYFELYYTVRISYPLTKSLAIRGNFITIPLLQQLLSFDTRTYTKELLYGIECL